MKFYFAPMEGITGHVFRNVYHSYFKNIDAYFTPFIAAHEVARLKSKELRDIIPENNKDVPLIPQLLTNKSVDFINTARRIQSLGYNEINLNLGCPSGTVVGKKRGSGFLAYPEELDKFLDEIFNALPDIKISIKTRLGLNLASEFETIYDIYKKYPMSELIVHPRTRKDMYMGDVHLDEFEKVYNDHPFPVGYNGNIFTVADYENIVERFPEVNSIMLGRGLLMDPTLLTRIQGGEGMTKEFALKYVNDLFDEYRQEMKSDKDTVFKMKELWGFMFRSFKDCEKELKEIRKCNTSMEYKIAAKRLIERCELN